MQLSYRGTKYQPNCIITPSCKTTSESRYPAPQLFAALRYRGSSYMKLVAE